MVHTLRHLQRFLHLKYRTVENHTDKVALLHILNQVTNIEKLFSYDIGENIEWIDVESPAHADRNKDIIEKILLQMRSGFGSLD